MSQAGGKYDVRLPYPFLRPVFYAIEDSPMIFEQIGQ